MPQTRYTRDHEWVRMQDGLATVGLTRFALDALGQAMLVMLPAVGRHLRAGEPCGSIESVKAASDACAPLAGEVAAINGAVQDNPALLNADPHGAGWLYRLRLDDPAAFGALLDQDAYDALVQSL